MDPGTCVGIPVYILDRQAPKAPHDQIPRSASPNCLYFVTVNLHFVYYLRFDVAINEPIATPMASPVPHHRNEPNPDDDCNSKNFEN